MLYLIGTLSLWVNSKYKDSRVKIDRNSNGKCSPLEIVKIYKYFPQTLFNVVWDVSFSLLNIRQSNEKNNIKRSIFMHLHKKSWKTP